MSIEHPFYLIQRLHKPVSIPSEQDMKTIFDVYKKKAKAEPALREVINNFFRLDYMGSSEYEFGAFRSCMEEFVQKQGKLSWHVLNIKGSPRVRFASDAVAPTQEVKVYVCCEDADLAATHGFFAAASLSLSPEYKLKERAYIQEGLFGAKEEIMNAQRRSYKPPRFTVSARPYRGWIELEAKFFATPHAAFAQAFGTLLQVPLPNEKI